MEKDRVKFGLSLNVNDPVLDSLSKSVEAERLGLDHIWVSDLASQRYAPVVASAVASTTSKIRIGLGLMSPFLHTAQQIASSLTTLIESYGGRFDLCIGPGDRDELRRAGVDLDAHKGIPQYLLKARREISEILKDRDIECKIWLGAQGPELLKIASSFDGVLLNYASPVMIEWALKVIGEGPAERPNSIGISAASYIYDKFKPEIHRILRFASATVALGASSYVLRKFSLAEALEPALQQLQARPLDSSILKLVPSDIIERFCILKSQSELPKYIDELKRLGVQQIVFSYPQGYSTQTIKELAAGLTGVRRQHTQ